MLAASDKPVYERVFTVSEWYDGPRQGVASFNDQPHFYDCCADVLGYTDLFLLTPLTHTQLELVLEDWAIWRKWQLAFHSGETPEATHPALPADRARHEQLKSLLDHVLRTDAERSIIQMASFRVVKGSNTPAGIIRDLEVHWSATGRHTAQSFE
jgi:hypothetical protein